MSLNSDRTLLHKPLKEEIFDALHKEIIAGKYAPGDWLRQDVIANQMGVSMTPVREALDLLVAAGLAERVAYRGVRVREMSTRDIGEAYGLRLLLEAEIAREAARHVTADQIRTLDELLGEMRGHESLNDMSIVRQLSREFHNVVAEASANNLLIKLYEVVSNAFPDWLLYEALFRHPDLLTDSMNATHREHVEIVNALKQGNERQAVQKSIEHVMESGKWLHDYLNMPADLLREKEKIVLMQVPKP